MSRAHTVCNAFRSQPAVECCRQQPGSGTRARAGLFRPKRPAATADEIDRLPAARGPAGTTPQPSIPASFRPAFWHRGRPLTAHKSARAALFAALFKHGSRRARSRAQAKGSGVRGSHHGSDGCVRLTHAGLMTPVLCSHPLDNEKAARTLQIADSTTRDVPN